MPQHTETALTLTPTQQGMLFHHLSGVGTGVDIEQIVCTLDENVDTTALKQAWTRVLERHGALRSRFAWEDVDDPIQEPVEHAVLEFSEQDWRQLAEDEQTNKLQSLLAAERARGFDLREAPCMRIAICRLAEERWQVVWTFHHIVCDGRSFPIVLGDVFGIYAELTNGSSYDLDPPRPFAEHVEHIADQDLSGAESFWRERLNGFCEPTPLPGNAMAEEAVERGHVEHVLSETQSARLAQAAKDNGFSLNTLLQGAWAVLLGRYSGTDEVVFGATRSGRRSSIDEAESMVGCFINTLPVRTRLDAGRPVAEWLGQLAASEREVREHEQSPLMSVQGWASVPAGRALFDSLIVFDYESLDAQMHALGPEHDNRRFQLIERTNYPLTLYVYAESSIILKLAYDEPQFDEALAERIVGSLVNILQDIADDPSRCVDTLSIVTAEERQKLLIEWNDTARPYEQACIHQAFEAQVERTPDADALAFRNESVTYAELNGRANRLAYHLLTLGVGPDVPVALCAERNIELIVALLAIHKAGGCYVPLDPDYPVDRLTYMLEDSEAPVLVTQRKLEGLLPANGVDVVLLDDQSIFERHATRNPPTAVTPSSLAYIIYTSGSTGKPKGTMVEHRNVLNFFTAMDEQIDCAPQADGSAGTWMAVTSLSFDISVLELFWPLVRGFRVVLHEDQQRAVSPVRQGEHAAKAIDFSLMYFASSETAGEEKYRLLIEGAKFADAHGFSAIWTPERHFHEFGGLYPNPSVANAAIAMVTKHIGLRAGSVVVPLHHPARVAEEWALVDNLSDGRVGISFASGWQPRDFVLAPEAFATARESMRDGIETIRRLWRGEKVAFPGPNGTEHEVLTSPKPVQAELPFWLTAAGSPETFRGAGEMGGYLLTHLLGQTTDELAEKLALYRQAWREAGHPGDGHVTLMLHTFVGDDTDDVRETVRRPMMDYLGSSLGLVKGFAESWSAFKKGADGSTTVDIDLDSLTEDEMEGLLEYSFERYFETSGLFGDTDRALGVVDSIKGMGVDEIACLIDFGVSEEQTLAHLSHLNRVKDLAQPAAEDEELDEGTVAGQIVRFGVTHLQCTPSLASMLVQDEATASALGSLKVMMVGGEACPPALAAELKGTGMDRLLNMYGPTETTIWSTVHEIAGDEQTIPIGKPIANTSVYILDDAGELVPPGIGGELYIGGDGVVRGYLNRGELTAERFVTSPLADSKDQRLYRTGDLARWRSDGVLEFLGRIDHQVKIRGHRIELGEVEAALGAHESVREAVVIPREDNPGDVRLVGYVVAENPEVPPATQELRDYLRGRLPEAMVPSHLLILDAFPQTPNLKIDRKALPAPSEVQPESTGAGGSAPTTELEVAIAEVWCEVLNVAGVGLEDNFFDLGGHSLLAVKTQRRLNEVLDQSVAITDLFRFPSVQTLAEYLSGGSSGASLQDSHERGAQRRAALAARRASRTNRAPER